MKSTSKMLFFRWSTTLSILLGMPELAFAALPQVDFNRMGHVGLAGTFAGLDLFDNSSSLSFDPSTSTLLARAVDGSLTRLGSTNVGGKISAGCALGELIYLGGSFSSFNGTSASNVASFSPSTESLSALGNGGPNGDVNALFCDSANSRVWAGGSFTSPGSAVAIWDTKASSWSAPPFGGLSGAASEVLSITTNSSSSSIFFAGSFVTSFQGNGSIIVNNTNNPNVPFSPGATPFTSSLVPVPLQGAQIDASPSSSDPQFNNIENILCPAGADGPGNTWLADDGFKAVITVREFAQLSASGVRLGNTFQDNRSTTGFSVTSIPDNHVQTLTFFDPTTGANQTCSDPCPLLTDPSIPYQDFIFPATVSLTGFQLTLSEWEGAGPGLHLLQLLSSGAFASAVAARNNISCFAPNPSNVTLFGTWTEEQVTTDIAGTIQDVLTALVDVGTPSAQAPSITWMPYVSASGDYTVNLLIPGCTNFQDCGLRTSVKVTVFPGGGLDPVVTTVSEQNTEDVSQQIYSGPIFPSSPGFVVTVTMNLADQPQGTGQNGHYELIADRIELQLTSTGTNTTSTSGGASDNSSSSTQHGFGFFEWPLSDISNADANGVLPNSTETEFDKLAFQLFSAVGGNNGVPSTLDAIATVAHHPSGAIFLGGNFSFSAGSNIIAYKDGMLSSLSDGGLNGPVAALLIEGNILFVGGSFTDTSSPSTNGSARGIASYNISSNSWSGLDAGVDGEVTSLNFVNGQLAVAGNFTRLLSTPGIESGPSAGGFAVWDPSNSTWANSGGYVSGSMTFVGNSTSPSKGQDQTELLAGNVAASLKFGASGFVMLQNGASNSDGIPAVSPLGVQLQAVPQAVTTVTTPTKRRRSHARRSDWMQGLPFSHLFTRQSSATPTPLPPSPPAPAPAVLAGAFWTNTSSSHDIGILGGNFSFSTTSSADFEAVAFYDLTTTSLTALAGNPLNGTVRALLVLGSSLYIGGEFTVVGSDVIGLAIYDLAKQQLDMSGLQALQGSSGSRVVVRSLTMSAAKSNTVIVAGSFVNAGSLPCAGICQLDTGSKQWSALGSGISGEVASVAYAGNDQNLLFASGSITLTDNSAANVAMFSFDNSTWTAVGNSGDLPGPVTAVEVDNGNSSSIFAAGRSNDGSLSFLNFWNGQSWTSFGSNFEGDTNITQLTVVPLQDTHAANAIIEQDRMLLISGSIVSSSFGNVSSALFDGQNFFPYIVSSSSSGTPGTISSLFSSISNFSFSQRHLLATGVVILISIAIAAGVVFFLALLGILWTLFARRDSNGKFDPADFDDDDSAHHRPSSLLEHINAATRTTILGAGIASPFDGNKEKEEEAGGASTAHGHDPFAAQDAGDYLRADTPSDAIAGIGAGLEEQSRPAHARYSFDGTGDGELPLSVGQELEVLDDRDHAWWYTRDVNTGQEGVVPAAYLY